MEDNINFNNDNDESKKIVNNFKNELERLKQKLSKDFYKYSQIEKDKNKTNLSNYHFQNTEMKNEPNQPEVTEIKNEKISTNQNLNQVKIPSLDELKEKYGINLNNRPSSIKDISIEAKFKKENKFKKISEINEDELKEEIKTINDVSKQIIEIEKKEENLNERKNSDTLKLNKKENNIDIANKPENTKNNNMDEKYNEIMNILNIKKETDIEIKNLLNKKELLDLSEDKIDIDNKEDKEANENKNFEKEHIDTKEDEEDEIAIINKFINDDKMANNNINISIYKNNINNNNINNNNNISYFSNISNINNNNPQLMIEIPGKESTLKKSKKSNMNRNNQTELNTNKNLDTENKNNPLATYESPTKNNNNNNNSVLDTSVLNSKLDQQIKFINEKSEDNRKEEEKNQMILREIENSLQLDERLKHKNREIRKNAIKELCEMCTNFNNDEEDKQKAFECFSPWVKFCMEETNSYVIPESLNFFILFNTLFPHFLATSMTDFFNNVERYVKFGISSINENCFKIFFLIFQDKKLFGLGFNSIIKLLNTSVIKMVKFLNGLLITMIENNILPENYLKILFEKLVHIYIKLGNKATEKKKLYSKLLLCIYNNIEDDYNMCIKNNIKVSSYKEIDSLFLKATKNKKKFNYRLYPKNENYNNNITDNKNNIGYNIDEKVNRNKTPIKGVAKEKNNINNLIINNNNSPDVNDVVTILPNEFFEFHLLTQFQPKIKLLEQANNILNKIKTVKDKEKNLFDVYRTINYSIEDSNILIHLEGIKLLENICRLVQNYINNQKLKLLLETCFDKLKDKKSLVKNELFTLFNMIIENHCFEIDKFILFMLQFCTNQKKENAQVKIGLFEYIKLLFYQENNILSYELLKLKEKDYYSFIKKIVSIIQKESLSTVKDLCSDLLIIFKKKCEDTDTFFELISELPSYRKKLIEEETGGRPEDGTEYRKSLKRVKSSYSFSKTRYGSGFKSSETQESRHERTKSNIRVNNFERHNSTNKINSSFSSGKNIKVKNKLVIKTNNNDYRSKSKNNTKNNFNKNPKAQTGGFAKFNPKKSQNSVKNTKSAKILENNFKNQKKIQLKKNSNDNLDINDNEENNFENNNDLYYQEELQESKNDKSKKNKKINSKEDFNHKKEDLLENIHNLDIDSIDKYSKIIIRDFLIFVKKICDVDEEKEDLSYHFNIIFMIFEKILYRIIVLLNKHQAEKDKYSKLKKILDELIQYISKIIIITPCIDQIQGTEKFDLTLLETFMEKIKEFCLNQEKFYMHLLLSLYNFCEKDEEYPKDLDPKPSVVYFLKYLKQGYLETKSDKLLNVLKEFISETKLLNLEEKKNLLIDNNTNIERNIEDSFNQIMDESKHENENNTDMNEIIKTTEQKITEIQKNDNLLENDNNENINESFDQENYNDKIKKDILNINENEIDNINTNNIAVQLKNFEDKLNKISNKDKDTTTITGSEDIKNKNLKFNDNQHTENINVDDDEEEDNLNNNINKSKINDNDFKKIEDSIKLMSKRLDNTLNKMNEASNRNNNSRKTNLLSNNNNLNSSNTNSINISKISDNNNNNASIITSESYIKNNLLNFNSNLTNNQNIYENNNIKDTVEQIIKVIKGELNENNIFQNAKLFFFKLTSIDEKFEFIKLLRNKLDNPVYLSQTSINTCTNLFDLILLLLAYQILNQSDNEQLISELQAIAEYLLCYRNLNDMFKIMIFLLRKYFPKNLNNKIEDISLVMIKVISYLLKELLKKMISENINGKEIISEINDLFVVTPPSTLTTATPNARLYQHIFTLLKSITDQIIIKNKNELSDIIKYLQENKIVCEDYVQYLIKLKNRM